MLRSSSARAQGIRAAPSNLELARHHRKSPDIGSRLRPSGACARGKIITNASCGCGGTSDRPESATENRASATAAASASTASPSRVSERARRMLSAAPCPASWSAIWNGPCYRIVMRTLKPKVPIPAMGFTGQRILLVGICGGVITRASSPLPGGVHRSTHLVDRDLRWGHHACLVAIGSRGTVQYEHLGWPPG